MKRTTLCLLVLLVGCNPQEDILPEPDGGTTTDTTITTSDTITTDTVSSSDSTTTDETTSDTTSETTTGDVGGEVSGSRIRLKYRVGDDGVKINAGAYDSLLKTDCVFLSASDGVARCLPSPIMSGGRFSDAMCATPIAYRFACSAPLAFIPVSNGDLCATTFRVHQPGATFVGPTFVKNSAGTCVAVGALPAEYEAFLLGPEMAASEFVGSSIVTE